MQKIRIGIVLALFACLLVPVSAQTLNRTASRSFSSDLNEPGANSVKPLVSEPIPDAKRIAVPSPKAENLGEADTWLPIFAQGQITTNLQKYSTMTVIDRMNLEAIQKEQRLSESAAFSDDTMITAGLQLAAEYLANLHIIKKGTNYSVTLTITDTTSAAIVESVSNANASRNAVEDGSAFNELTYEVLTRLGMGTDSVAELITTTDAAVLSANTADIQYNQNLARGLAAQQTTGNIVEALTYYNKSVGARPGISEASQRLADLTTNLSSGSIGENALNEIALRKQWEKIFADFESYANKNCTYVVYSPNVTQGKINYQKETVDVVIYYVYGVNPDVEDLYHQIFGAYATLGKNGHDTRNWGLSLEDTFRYTVYFDILDDNGNTIGTSEPSSSYSSSGSHRVVINDYRIKGLTTATVSVTCPADKVTGNIQINVRTSTVGGLVYAR